jgi:hypothetical protein
VIVFSIIAFALAIYAWFCFFRLRQTYRQEWWFFGTISALSALAFVVIGVL